MEGSCGGKKVRLTAAYEGLKRLNARRQTALREGAELIFRLNGPADESL